MSEKSLRQPEWRSFCGPKWISFQEPELESFQETALLSGIRPKFKPQPVELIAMSSGCLMAMSKPQTSLPCRIHWAQQKRCSCEWTQQTRNKRHSNQTFALESPRAMCWLTWKYTTNSRQHQVTPNWLRSWYLSRMRIRMPEGNDLNITCIIVPKLYHIKLTQTAYAVDSWALFAPQMPKGVMPKSGEAIQNLPKRSHTKLTQAAYVVE